MKEKILERFLRYVKTDTQSDPDSNSFQAQKNRFNLLKYWLTI